MREGATCMTTPVLRAVIADDEPWARSHLRALLDACHVRTLAECSTGHEAIAAAAQERPDVVCLDVRMPDLDGLEVARRLRENPATSAIPIVMLTAKSLSVNRVEGILAGADDYLTKPVNPVELD